MSTPLDPISRKLCAFGCHSYLDGWACQHASAVLHDARHLGGVDPVAFNPRSDREQIGIADRIPLTHDPWTLQKLVLDQLEAFRRIRRHFALHSLDCCSVVCPPCAPHAMGVRDMHGRAKVTVELLNL